nr:uncharacterized protein LOC124805947 [Hydra vulgaris]
MIDGIPENDNESWNDCELKVEKIFNDYLGVHNVKIERAHRTGIIENKKHRTIVLKLIDFKDKTEILKNSFKLKGKDIYISEDYCMETNLIRKKLRDRMKVERQAGKYAYIPYDKLIVRDWNTRKRIATSNSHPMCPQEVKVSQIEDVNCKSKTAQRR